MKLYDVCVVFASLLVIGVLSPILGCAWLREFQEKNWNPRGDDYPTNAPPASVAADEFKCRRTREQLGAIWSETVGPSAGAFDLCPMPKEAK